MRFPFHPEARPVPASFATLAVAVFYGMLSPDGRVLYVADAVNYRRYRFDLSASGAREEAPSDRFRCEQDEKIRAAIEAIDRFSHFGETGEVPHD